MNALVNAITNNASTILTTAGIGAMAGGTVLAVKATPKAMYKIDALKKERAETEGAEIVQDKDGNDLAPDIKLTLKDYIKACWLDYMPAAVAMGVGVACILVARHIDAAKIVALASAAKYAQDKLEEHQKALNKLEPADREKVEHAINQVLIDEAGTPPPWDLPKMETDENGELVPITVDDYTGDMLCLDSLSGQYFRSNPDKIQRAANLFNRDIIKHNGTVFGADFGSVNDFFELLDMSTTELFGALGWTSGHELDVYFDSDLLDDTRPVLVLKYRHQPKILDDALDLK